LGFFNHPAALDGTNIKCGLALKEFMHTTQQLMSEGATKGKQNKSPFFPQYVVQAKLQVNEPGDSYEREADAMADQVMRMTDTSTNQNSFFRPAVSSIQRKCQHCEGEEMLHRKESSEDEVKGSSQLDSYVASLGSSGQPLPETSRKFFEPRFGHDFSNVRIHNDGVAAKSAQSINALAYTTGNNIVFNNGQFSPDSDNGKRLMAHELTHVVQQGGEIQSKKIQRASQGKSARCTDPLIIPDTNASIDGPIDLITAAETRAIEVLDNAISELDFTRQQIVGGAPVGFPTVSDSLGQAIRLLAGNPDSDNFWKRTGLGTADLILRRLRAFRGIIASGNMFYVCLGRASGSIGVCAGTICGADGRAANAASCAGAFQTHFCNSFWEESDESKAETIIHEISHNFAFFIQDSGREGNAGCYSRFAQVAAGVDASFQRADLCPDP
jgi:hypothetical protein